MKNKYRDLIEQTFDFPTEDFKLQGGDLVFCDIDIM